MNETAVPDGKVQSGKSSELARRVAVAVVAAPVALWVFWLGDAALATFLGMMSAVSAWELYRIARAGGSTPMTYVGVVLAALMPIAVHAQYLKIVQIPNVVAALVMLIVVALSIWTRGVAGRPLSAAAVTLFGAAYTGGTLSFAYALRYFGYAVGDVSGFVVLMLPVVLTWASDTGAYFAGRAFKGPKLIPAVSPAKTVSGAVGGILLTIIVCVFLVRFFLKPYAQLGFTPWGLLVFGLGVSVAAQLGDLAESLFKREAGVKDSGTILPGHGGALDRLDSLFFVLPVAYTLYWWFADSGSRFVTSGVGRTGVALLGSTGSVGNSALRVLERQRELFQVVALTAHENAAALRAQVEQWHPAFVGMVNEQAADSAWCKGPQCLVEAATHPDAAIVLNAVVGAAGLPATLAGLQAGRRVALANKESLVIAGDIVMETARARGGMLVPVDSEHSAILQCLAGRRTEDIRRLIITASGGPFRSWTSERIAAATIADALNHPTWKMGSKITVDSATLANKALEVIEAHHLFGVPYDRIEVVVHPQSIVHSFVEFIDGSVVAQMGVPSMELPILFALTWPERVADTGVPRYEPTAQAALTFEPVREQDFPMLGLGIRAGRAGGAAAAVFNAANEASVALFLGGKLRFADISSTVSRALDALSGMPGATLEALLGADAAARRFVNSEHL